MERNEPEGIAIARGLEEVPKPVTGAHWRGYSPSGLRVRLFLTCWLVYALHFSPYIYRELYLTMSLAERHTVHVDQYVDLHPDLFVMPGRGSFVGTNPGLPLLAALPYSLFLPLVNRFAPVRPPRPGEKVSAIYHESHPDRLEFYEKVRERGLDVHLGAAAMITACFFMAPLSALSVVVMFGLLCRLFSIGRALGLALLYAFGTPIFFRTATLSLNLLVALLGLFSFALLWRPSGLRAGREPLRYFAAGLLAGWAVVTDYSGVITVSALGLFALALQLEKKRFWPALRRSLWFLAGTIGPVLFLLFWQWYCYGNPWHPVQYHMPQKYYMGYEHVRGFGWPPMPGALWGLLFDPAYGLSVFSPILTLALGHFVLLRRRANVVSWRVAAFAWAFFLGLWVFCSCIEYTLRFQWMDGVRYIVPVVPFLFLLVADVMMRIPRAVAYALSLAAVLETWCLAMVRENPLESVTRVFLHGFELPWLTTLVKAAPQYMPELARGASPIPLFVLCSVLIWGIWSVRMPWRALGAARSEP